MLGALRLPKTDETPNGPFRDEDIHRVLASIDPTDEFGLRDYVLLHTLWDTGMRVGELVNLTRDDIDLQTSQIRVAHTKFGKWRDIGFGKQTHKYLTRYLAMGRAEPVDPEDRHLFLAQDSYPLTERSVQKICWRISRRCGVHVHAHRFRHTFAVAMLKNGTDLRTLQRLMGHADIRILARYLNLASDDAIRAHHTNSPADQFHAQQRGEERRMPMRRNRRREE